MAITYTWNFSQFDTAPKKDDLDDVVVVIHWRLTAVDGDYSASNYGTVELSVPSPDDFTPFSDITFDDTVRWVNGAMDVPAIEESLSNQIDTLKNPPVVPMKPPFDS
jgi:hypothetical protein